MIQRIIAGVIGGFIAAYLSEVTWRVIAVSYSDFAKDASPMVFFSVWFATIFLGINLSTAKKAWRALSYFLATLCMLSPAAWLLFTYGQVANSSEPMYVTGGSALFVVSFIVGWPLSLILFLVGWLIGREKKQYVESGAK